MTDTEIITNDVYDKHMLGSMGISVSDTPYPPVPLEQPVIVWSVSRKRDIPWRAILIYLAFVGAVTALILFAAGCKSAPKPVQQAPVYPQADYSGTTSGSVPAISTSTPTVSTFEPNPDVAKLAAYAEARGIRWRIVCMDDGYMAWAIQKDANWAQTWEEGAKPDWSEINYPTQGAAVRGLYRLLHGPPNQMPEHETPPEEKKPNGKKCLAPLTSENYKNSCTDCSL